MTRVNRFLAVAFVVEAVTFGAIGVLLFDMVIHGRVAPRDGVNRWGYRGAIVRHVQPRENRLVVVGGSAAFGYGRPLDETFPSYLERNLQQRWRKGFRAIPVSVVNLAAVPDGAESFLQTLHDYQYLEYDIVCFYDGYNSLARSQERPEGWRRQSVLFRQTGYWPILPLLVTGRSPVGRPLPVSSIELPATQGGESSCGPTWTGYCEVMAGAVRFVLDSGKTALVVTPPFLSAIHAEQQRLLAADLRRRFGGRDLYRYVNLGTLVDLGDRALSFDGAHLTATGNDRVADTLTLPVMELLR
jgi:hypothetical protein